MFDVKTLRRGADGQFYAVDKTTKKDVVISEMFPSEMWDNPKAFEMAGIKGYEPMTAKELETEDEQDSALNNPDYIVEEKFDGTRALVYILGQDVYEDDAPTGEQVGFCRVFSRRISKKTGFYVENTDSLPHIREIDAPDYAGTILDGEMLIDGLPFKEASSTLNCLWDKAVDRQIEKGFITFHAFDILFYRGIDLRKFPLMRRKHYLELVVKDIKSPFIKCVKYRTCGRTDDFMRCFDEAGLLGRGEVTEDDIMRNKKAFPDLYECCVDDAPLTAKAFYELVVITGGEGVMVKPKDGKYLHKRGWEYSKIKKFLTREMVVLGFSEPTKEYTGKEIKKWAYWVDAFDKRVVGNFYGDSKYKPVTKHYYNRQVGNLLLGVFITHEDYMSMNPSKRGTLYDPQIVLGEDYETDLCLMQVCECSGFDDETREYFTSKQSEMCGMVIEVKANEIFKDSGKLRHPRYLRVRRDKNPEDCRWESHIAR